MLTELRVVIAILIALLLRPSATTREKARRRGV